MIYQQTETLHTLIAALGISRSTWRRLHMAGRIPKPVRGMYPRDGAGKPSVLDMARWDSVAVFDALGRPDLSRQVVR